jgi:hypothetical protein
MLQEDFLSIGNNGKGNDKQVALQWRVMNMGTPHPTPLIRRSTRTRELPIT